MDQQIAEVPHPTTKPADDRGKLAVFRTHLALERTTLAWIRTTLTMATFGFGLVGFFRSLRSSNPTAESIRLHEGAIRFGIWLIVLGIGATLLASGSHLRTLRRLRMNEVPSLSRWPLSVTVAFLIALAGFAGLWAVLGH